MDTYEILKFFSFNKNKDRVTLYLEKYRITRLGKVLTTMLLDPTCLDGIEFCTVTALKARKFRGVTCWRKEPFKCARLNR